MTIASFAGQIERSEMKKIKKRFDVRAEDEGMLGQRLGALSEVLRARGGRISRVVDISSRNGVVAARVYYELPVASLWWQATSAAG